MSKAAVRYREDDPATVQVMGSSMFRLAAVCVMLMIQAPAMGGLVPVQEWCVTSSAQLQAALTAAETNDSVDVIRVATGYYIAPPGGFHFNAGVEDGDGFALTVSGGWSEALGGPCGQQLTQNPFNTILDAEGESRVMRLRGRSTTNISVHLLAFLNGYVNDTQRGGGLQISRLSSEPYNGNIVIERNAFIGNEAAYGGGLATSVIITDGNARISVVNNVFAANHARNEIGAADIVLIGGNSGPSGAGIRVTNNTVVNNTAGTDPSDEGGMHIAGSAPTLYVVNNIFWGNDNIDLAVSSTAQLFALNNNNIGVRSGPDPTSQSGNLSVEPVWEPCFLCFSWVPVPSSPLVDGGVHPPFISPFWYLTELDLLGKSRVHHGTVDIGAYESHARLFSDRFESN